MPTKKNNTLQTKKKVLEALEKTLGIVTTACKKVGLSRTQFYVWYKEDEQFRKDVDSVEGMALDFAESKLMENIGSKKETSIIFYLKTKGKKRGYIEKSEVDYTKKEPTLTPEDREKRILELKRKM
jgi:chaperonin GroEL (HSP60 family)